MLALAFIMILGFSALAIDVAHLYNVKNELQVAADSAALAGIGELTGATDAIKKDNALKAACRLAGKNCADVAYNNIPAAQQGSPIPVTLSTTYGVDVEVGNWDTTLNPVWLKERTPYNAVKVYARRTDANTNQPRAQNWFAKVFALLGRNFDFTAIQATALAAKIPLKILPIAVNEYWLAVAGISGRPYSSTVHDYPSSFVRQKEVAPYGSAQTATSPAFGYTFAILGANASSNLGSNDQVGFISMDNRSNYYFGAPVLSYTLETNGSKTGQVKTITFGTPSYFQAKSSTGGCSSSSTCNSYFTASTSAPSISSDKSVGDSYLLNGYPSNRLPPTAVYEYLRNTTGLGDYTEVPIPNVYNEMSGVSPDNDPSNCPYATLFYYDTSGGDPVSSEKVYDTFKAGDRFIAPVYDGTHAGPSTQGGTEKLLTIVGYVPIEVDGYANNIPNLTAGNNNTAWAANKLTLLKANGNTSTGNTMYGHALSDIIQPSDIHKGGCDSNLLNNIQAAELQFSYPRLVGTSTSGGITYGTKD